MRNLYVTWHLSSLSVDVDSNLSINSRLLIGVRSSAGWSLWKKMSFELYLRVVSSIILGLHIVPTSDTLIPMFFQTQFIIVLTCSSIWSNYDKLQYGKLLYHLSAFILHQVWFINRHTSPRLIYKQTHFTKTNL